MRTIRITIGALVAASALAATLLGAASASALEVAPLSKFVATPKPKGTFPLRIKGRGVGPQEFSFKRLRVTCQSAKVRGEVKSAEAETLELTVAYKECSGGPFVYGNIRKVTLPVVFRHRAALVYRYAGWLESLQEVPIFTKYLKCATDWQPGTYPEKAQEKPLDLYGAARYSTEEVANENPKLFPTGKQKKLLIDNEVKGKGLEWEEESIGVCEGEEFELSEGERGRYVGKLQVEVPNGNLEFKES
jgi:hypothetical protein